MECLSLACFPLNKSTASCISSPYYLPDSDKWFGLFLQELELIWLIYKFPSYAFFLSVKNCTMLIFFQSSSSLPILYRIEKMNANRSSIASANSFSTLGNVHQAMSVWKFAHFSRALIVLIIYLQGDILSKDWFRKATKITGLPSVDSLPLFIILKFFLLVFLLCLMFL